MTLMASNLKARDGRLLCKHTGDNILPMGAPIFLQFDGDKFYVKFIIQK